MLFVYSILIVLSVVSAAELSPELDSFLVAYAGKNYSVGGCGVTNTIGFFEIFFVENNSNIIVFIIEFRYTNLEMESLLCAKL
jgi:hypothetical protein